MNSMPQIGEGDRNHQNSEAHKEYTNELKQMLHVTPVQTIEDNN
jgi:hypothetical protein